MIDEEKLRSAFLRLKTRLDVLEEKVKELERQLEDAGLCDDPEGLTCSEADLWNY
jgi:ubiquitin